jgi:hypothetical protein
LKYADIPEVLFSLKTPVTQTKKRLHSVLEVILTNAILSFSEASSDSLYPGMHPTCMIEIFF